MKKVLFVTSEAVPFIKTGGACGCNRFFTEIF